MSVTRFHHLSIHLPEGVDFSLPLAGPFTRFLAWLVDFCVVLLACQLVQVVLGLVGSVAADLAGGLTYVTFFLAFTLYPLLLEWGWRGQTLGKRLLRLRVADAGGLRLRFHQVAARNLLRPIDALPAFYLVGGACALLTRRAQRLGDLAADTVVVRLPRPSRPDLAQATAGKYNSLRAHPVLVARLRQRVGPAEASLALKTLLRRDELAPGARVALFAALAARFRAAVPLPADLADDLADEPYVRDVVDVLYRTHATG